MDIKLVCFDLNKTIITENSWYDLNMALGVTPEKDQELFDEYLNSRITYEEWTKELFDIYKGHELANKTDMTRILSNYQFEDGAKEIIYYLKSKGYKVALISGAMDVIVDMVADEVEIELRGATNTFIFDDSGRLQDIKVLGDDKTAKVKLLEDMCTELGIGINECVCVGDGDNDIEMFRRTGLGVTFKDSKIESDAWKVIDNLSGLKSIL